MPHPLKVIFIGGIAPDAVIAELQRGGYTPETALAANREQLRDALNGKPDVAISDFIGDDFGAIEALQEIQQLNVDLPLIVVSGKIRDADVLSALKAGAA